MTLHRTKLAIAAVAITALPACSMWNSMTDRMTGRSPGADTASGSRGTMGTRGTMSGSAPMGTAVPGSAPSGGTSPGSAPMGGASASGAPPGGAPMGGSQMGGSAASGGSYGSGASGGSAGSTPGSSMTALRGGPTTAGAALPAFRSYNECKAWEAGQPAGSTALNRGQMQGGEVTLADQDLCARFPRS